MEGGGTNEAHSPGLIITPVHPCVLAVIHEWPSSFIGSRAHLQAVVLVRGWSSSFMGGGHVLGAHHLCMGVVVVCIVICGHGCCPCDWVVICGHCIVMHGWWGLFMGGVHHSWLGA